MKKVITSYALDKFLGYISHICRSYQERLTPIRFGDFVYYDCEEIDSLLMKPKAKKAFKEFIERNPYQIKEL